MGFLTFVSGRAEPHETPAMDVAAYAAAPSGVAAPSTVAEVMTQPVITVHPDLTVSEAQQTFRDHGFHHIPVTTISGTLVGMVSDRDVLASSDDAPNRWVLHVMSGTVLAATRDTPLRDVVQLMIGECVHALAIVDDHRHLMGIVTTTDLLRCFARMLP